MRSVGEATSICDMTDIREKPLALQHRNARRTDGTTDLRRSNTRRTDGPHRIDMDLIDVGCILPACTQNAVGLVACAMEELRQEAERGEKKTDEVLSWDLAHAIAEQHEREQPVA